MKVNIWLAWKELQGRKTRLLLNIILVALSVGLCISMELISRSREQAVDAKINFIGPPLRIVPEGTGEGMVTRYNIGRKKLPVSLAEDIKNRFSPSIFTLEGRLLFRTDIKGESVPVTGFDLKKIVTPLDSLKSLGAGEVASGHEVSKELKIKEGDFIQIRGSSLKVKYVLPTLGNNEDASVFINLKSAQEILKAGDSINVIRIYPGPGVSSNALGIKITEAFNGVGYIGSTREDVADTKIESSLQLYRAVLYGFAAFIVILTLMIGSHINATERKIELATLFAIGTTGTTVFLTLIARAFIVGIIGASTGYILGAASSLVYDFKSASGIVWSYSLFLISIGITAAVSVAATIPASVFAGFKNHVQSLQED